jgi:translation initiation factor IF-1
MRLSDAIKLRQGDTVTFYPWGPPVAHSPKRYGRDRETAEGSVLDVTPAGRILVELNSNGKVVWTTYQQVISFCLARRWPDGDLMNSWVELK